MRLGGESRKERLDVVDVVDAERILKSFHSFGDRIDDLWLETTTWCPYTYLKRMPFRTWEIDTPLLYIMITGPFIMTIFGNVSSRRKSRTDAFFYDQRSVCKFHRNRNSSHFIGRRRDIRHFLCLVIFSCTEYKSSLSIGIPYDPKRQKPILLRRIFFS